MCGKDNKKNSEKCNFYSLIHSFDKTLSSSSADRRSLKLPFSAIEMPPVSSLTTTAMQSLFCDIPKAALCRRPNDLGMSVSCEMGRMHPAALMRWCDMIMAPSCSGLFLKNMFSMSR